jgi:putative ABC transport system permease protein
MDLYAAQRAFAADGQINQIDLVLDPEADVASTRIALTAALPPGLEVQEPALRKEVVRDGVAAFQSMLTAFGLLAVVAGFVICYSRLGAIFEARTWEVGLLRAGGLRRSVVFRELLKESVLLGVAGALLGIPLGVLVARVGLPFLATTTALASNLPVPEAQLRLTSSDILLGLALGIGAAVGAAVMPALRMSRTHPVAALTMRGREMTSPAAPSSRWPLFLLISIGVLIVAQHLSGIRTLGLFTTVLIVAAGRVLATPLASYGSRLLKPLWNTWFGPAGRVAESHLERQPRRTALTVATLGIGLGSVLMLSILGWSFERSLVSTLTRWYTAQLVVSSTFAGGGRRSAPMSDKVVTKLREIPGVVAAAAEQQREIGSGDSSILVVAFDPPCFVDKRVCDWPIDGSDGMNALQSVAKGDAVLVSRSFAALHRTRPGTTIELPALHSDQTLTVAAITSGVLQNAVLMNRALYFRLWNDDLVTWIHVAVSREHDPKDIAGVIADRLGREYRLRVLDSAAMIDYFSSQVRQAFGLQYVMEAITLLLVLIGVGDTLAAGVISRTKEIGMMRAIGVHRGSIFQIVLLEGAGIAVLGLLLAVLLGMALGIFWVNVQFPAILGWNLELHPPLVSMAVMAGVTIFLCLCGALLPAIRAARLTVPTALRNE